MMSIIVLLGGCTPAKIALISVDDQKGIDHFFQARAKQREDIKHLMLEAKVDTFQKGKRVRGKAMMMMLKPNHLRIDTLSPFEQPITTLMISENELNFYNFQKNKFYHGDVSRNNLGRFLPMDLSLKQFMDLIAGLPPVIAFQKYELLKEKDGVNYHLILHNGDHKQEIIYHPTDFKISQMIHYKNGKMLYKIKFDQFVKRGEIYYGKKIYYENTVRKSKAKLKMIDLDLKTVPEKKLFKPLSNNFKRIEL